MNYRLIFILLFLFDCKSYMVLDKPDTQDYPITQIPKNKNIALVGFESYSYSIKGKSSLDYFLNRNIEKNAIYLGSRLVIKENEDKLAYRYAIAEENLEKTKLFGIGKPIWDYPIRGFKKENQSLKEGYNYILSEYLRLSKQSQFMDEIHFKSPDGKFRERNIDYYILAVSSPVFQESDVLGIISIILSGTFSFYSLSWVPLIDHQKSTTKFLILDKNLNLLDEFETSQRYFVLHTFFEKPEYFCRMNDFLSKPWFRGQMQPACVWEKNILEGRKRISKLLDSYK